MDCKNLCIVLWRKKQPSSGILKSSVSSFGEQGSQPWKVVVV